MPMTLHSRLLLSLSLIACKAIGNGNKFKPNCNLHEIESNYGTSDLGQILPHQISRENAWLQPSISDINRYYKIGLEKCEAFIKSNKFDRDYASVYVDSNSVAFEGFKKCRGTDLLFDILGIVVMPFGPLYQCPTYSHCWFGLLSCGNSSTAYLQEISKKTIIELLKTYNLSITLPQFNSFSLRAMNIHMRVVGVEITVPEQRYLTLFPASNEQHTDVIIAQYTLTHPAPSYTLELRFNELYPSVLYNWSYTDLAIYGMHNRGNIYLGGNEGRCRAWSRCVVANSCCGCDKKSFLPTSPIKVEAVDGSSRCSGQVSSTNTTLRAALSIHKSYYPKVPPDRLPLCAALKRSRIVDEGSFPGRWMLLPNAKAVCDKSNPNHNTFQQHSTDPASSNSSHDHETTDTVSQLRHLRRGQSILEAQGSPCVVNSHMPEENGNSHYFFAPYKCKYYFFTRKEAVRCLVETNNTHL